METIKKYENRKLYSTTLSKYVKLNYILDLVRTDQKFMVVDVKTDNDITTKTIQQSLSLITLTRDSLSSIIRGV